MKREEEGSPTVGPEPLTRSLRIIRRGPHPSFFEGWDSTVVSRVGFLADPCSASFIECTDDPHHPPFSQSARKGWGTRLLRRNPDRMDLTPNPCLQNEDIGTGAAKAARSLAISPGNMIAAISAKVLVQASIGIYSRV
jgi:hypothetical protein